MKVRNTWGKGILRKTWGLPVRARTLLRKQLHREPTAAEVSDAVKSGNTLDNLTPEEIIREYDEGREASIPFVENHLC